MKMLSNATVALVKSKAQLWIGYFLIFCIIVLGSVASYNYVTRLKLDTKVVALESDVREAEQRVQLVEEVNEQQATAIETIRGLNAVNDMMLSGLATDMESLRVRDRTAFNRLAALEKSNEAIRDYLNTAVPAPVGCVLDQTCPDQDADPVPGTERGSTSRVPPANPAPKPDQR